MSDKKNIQTNLLGRKARYARSYGPPISGSPMGKRWDEWGEIVVVRQHPTDGLILDILWSDGVMSHEMDTKMVEVAPEGSSPWSDGDIATVTLAETDISDFAIRTRTGLVVRVCEWPDENDTHIEVHSAEDFDSEGGPDSPGLYELVEPGDKFVDGKLVKKG